MKTVDLKELEIFTDISKRQQVRCDVRRDIANLIYCEMHGIEALASQVATLNQTTKKE